MEKVQCKYPPSRPPRINPSYVNILSGTGKDFIPAYINNITYIWLNNGLSMWIFPVETIDDLLLCYVWEKNKWRYKRISISNIDCVY